MKDAFGDFNRVFTDRIREADEFYAELHEQIQDEDTRRVQRQALAGMLWNKQSYHYDITQWLDGDHGQPAPPPQRKSGRNSEWTHVNIGDVLSMPDKWEYPWFAAWDLGFHCIAHALIDPDFAKRQLILLAREWYMHPMDNCPRTNGRSAMSTRRFTHSRPGVSTASNSCGPGEETSPSWSASFTS